MPKLRFLFFAAVGLGGLLYTFYPTIFSGFDRMQSDPGDVVLNNYFLEHTYRWAFDREYPHSFWSPGFFTPARDTFTYSETLVGTAPIYWLFRIGFSESVACQLWILLTFVLNYVSLVVVLRWFKVTPILTAAGAYFFAFGVIRTDHLPHQQLMPQYFSPFAIWYAWMMLKDPSIRRWITFLGLCVIQILASLHLGWFLGFSLLIFVACGFFVEAGSFRRVREFVQGKPIATMLPLLIAAVLLGMYARNFYRGTPGSRSYWEAAAYTPYPDGWFVSPPGNIWGDHFTPRDVEQFPEKMLFPGFAAYGIFLVGGLYAWRKKAIAQRTLTLACLGTSALLTMLVTRWGYDLSLWFFVHQLVPGANAFRAVGRIVFVIYLFGTIGGLLGVQELLRANVACSTRRGMIYALVGLCLIAEQIRLNPESFDKREMLYGPARELVPYLKGADAAHIINDGSMPDYRHQITAMWAGLWAKTPVTNGFSGTWPKDYVSMLDDATVGHLVKDLGPGWQGKLVVVEWASPIRRRVYLVRDGQATLVSE